MNPDDDHESVRSAMQTELSVPAAPSPPAADGDAAGESNVAGAPRLLLSRVRRAVFRAATSHSDALLVLGWALGLRGIFAFLTSITYDPDEFVLLALSRSFAHGAVPYRDFMFFHPPGVLVILRAIQPVINLWWPSARVLTLLADTGTALLTWRVGRELFGRRGGLAAGLLYGASPLALITSVRLGQDPLITLCGMAGLTLLVTTRSHRGAVLAGACLALGVWIKYPALLFLPIYLLAAPRRAVTTLLSAGLVGALLFAPFVPTLHALVQQTVVWQHGRSTMALDLRLERLGVFWLLVNVLAIPALFMVRRPWWLLAGFSLGGAFFLAPQLWLHYLLPVVPFAALLAAPLIVRVTPVIRRTLPAGAFAVTVAWAMAIDFGNPSQRLFATASHFSEIRPVVRLLDRAVTPETTVLADRFEYPYLAQRPVAMDYFWNLHGLVSAGYLERHLHGVRVVIDTDGLVKNYPSGFIDYLAAHRFTRLRVGQADVWLAAGADSSVG